MTDKPMIVITGCGRSGTMYTARLLASLGFDVGHEKLGKDGVVSWTLVGTHGVPSWFPSYEQIKNQPHRIVHQVRHPVDAIAPMTTIAESSWKFIGQNIDCDPARTLRRAMQYWVYWNARAEGMAGYTYRVENMGEELRKLLTFFGREVEEGAIARTLSNQPRDLNVRLRPELTWEALEREDAELATRARELARHYGYRNGILATPSLP